MSLPPPATVASESETQNPNRHTRSLSLTQWNDLDGLLDTDFRFKPLGNGSQWPHLHPRDRSSNLTITSTLNLDLGFPSTPSSCVGFHHHKHHFQVRRLEKDVKSVVVISHHKEALPLPSSYIYIHGVFRFGHNLFVFYHKMLTEQLVVDSSLLVLCGKSLSENETAKAIKTNNTLKLPDNGDLSLVLHSEFDKSVMQQQSFQVSSYMNSLSTDQFGRLLIWSPRLNSTHDVVSRNFCELPIGTVCVADVQTKGRGRSKNVWESPLGCLMFSFTLQMEDGRVVPLVQYVVSLAITEAVKDICDKNGLPCIDVKIKWPNDLYINGFKVGGILCTSTYKSKKFNVSAESDAWCNGMVATF
ncbi:Biotinyl protein ligase [Sesbania bispinosa]|nr:Biotinyl protein ligase [Sesbania bispinosa]